MMMDVDKQAIVLTSSSSQRKRKRKNEEQVMAPSSTPNDMIEEIFLRLPVKTLIRFKSLSKQWRCTIESHYFVERYSKISRRDLKLMFISQQHTTLGRTRIGFETVSLDSASRLSFTHLDFHRQFNTYHSESCNGLFCIYSRELPLMCVVNPATGWRRDLPLAQCLLEGLACYIFVAFVKAADYKLVTLYNSIGWNLHDEGVKCEVFNFRANRWRYVSYTPSYRVFQHHKPAFANGSLYWLTEKCGGEVKVVAFDIHTEKFRLLPNIPLEIASSDPKYIDMCSLDHHLCMSTRDSSTNKKIWRLKSPEDVWEEIYTINFLSCSSLRYLRYDGVSLTPVAICKNKKILLLHRDIKNMLVKYDPRREVLHGMFKDYTDFEQPCKTYSPYFQTLISHI